MPKNGDNTNFILLAMYWPKNVIKETISFIVIGMVGVSLFLG
jgi:hypothetical protein